MEIREVDLPLEAIAEQLRPIVSRDAPSERKLLIARAAIPMPPTVLLPCLAYLLYDPDQRVREQSKKTLMELPAGTVVPILSSEATHPGVLDRLARIYHAVPDYLEKLALNRATDDQTVLRMAQHSSGPVLEIIARNQVRLTRCPDLVEALYFNPNTRMSTVSRVVEFAVRENLPIQNMPGYREIVAAVMGQAKISRPTARLQTAGKPQAARPQSPLHEPKGAWTTAKEGLEQERWEAAARGEELVEDDLEKELLDSLMGAGDDGFAAKHGEESEGLASEGTSSELDEEELDDAFFAILASAMVDEEKASDVDDERAAIFAEDKVRDLTVAQKIRLALIGNSSYRLALVKDPNKLVAAAVLRNPGLTEKEIVGFVHNRAISQEVIQIIGSSREWTKNYLVKLGLVTNPKTPPHIALTFLRHLRVTDLKSLVKNRDVPHIVAKTAKRTLEAMQTKRS